MRSHVCQPWVIYGISLKPSFSLLPHISPHRSSATALDICNLRSSQIQSSLRVDMTHVMPTALHLPPVGKTQWKHRHTNAESDYHEAVWKEGACEPSVNAMLTLKTLPHNITLCTCNHSKIQDKIKPPILILRLQAFQIRSIKHVFLYDKPTVPLIWPLVNNQGFCCFSLQTLCSSTASQPSLNPACCPARGPCPCQGAVNVLRTL